MPQYELSRVILQLNKVIRKLEDLLKLILSENKVDERPGGNGLVDLELDTRNNPKTVPGPPKSLVRL
jgi:hypothetical protein